MLLSACYHASAADGDTDTDSRPDTAPDTGTAPDSAPDTAPDSGTAPDTGVAPDTDIDTEPVIPVENEWIFIEGGTFEMGHVCDPPPEVGTCWTEPVHTVTVPSFYMQKTEVTVHQYRQCVDAGACTEPDTNGIGAGCDAATTGYAISWIQPRNENHALNCVSWSQADAYCRWLGGRLPSESEWEYAARSGGKDVTYPWGEDEPSCDYAIVPMYNEVRGEWEWGCKRLYTSPQPVCSRPKGNNALGMCDLSGNVEEFVQDAISREESYPNFNYANPKHPSDGTAYVSNDIYASLSRGGSYRSTENPMLHLSVYFRSQASVENGSASTGIRCAK
ncbi:MAG: SUMF1/EgtB/PvdO family nonheme iron enzyme [Proteobacteria bacterium]|nr:SUMF1/EgtB/PvdO family nonheme iron enzyme [Pseudomonadota bacterium]